MTSFGDWVRGHETEDLLVVYWLISSAIGAMPMPDGKSSKLYGWFFAFANTFAANIFRVSAATSAKIEAKSPQPPKP